MCACLPRRYANTASGGFESLNYDEAEYSALRAKYFLTDAERLSVRRRELAVTWVLSLIHI